MTEIVQVSLFDYTALDTETRIVVQQRTEEIKVLVRRSAQDIIDIGNKLIDVKSRLGHGNFGGWLDAEFGWTQQTAVSFMRVADKFKNFLNLENFGASALYLLAAPSTPEAARIEAIERAQAGEVITHKLAQGIVAYSKAADLPPNASRLTLQPPPASTFVSPRPLGEVVRSETRFAPAPPIRDDEEFDDTEDDTEDMDTSATHRFGHWARVSGPAGSYRQNGDTKFCEKCKSLWAADLPYCPYCNISPDARAYEAQQQKNKLRLAASNHAVSDDPDYDGDEWYTPAEIIESARLVMGSIDLDPATCEDAQKVVGAEKFYTKDDDSLRDDICWYGNVWLNPPYSAKLIIQFIEKLIAEYDNGNITQAIVITNNSSETDWFQNLLDRFPTCFKRRRAKFWRPNTDDFGARQGQAIFYLGDNVGKFCEEFSKLGVVVSKHDNQ